MPRSFRFVPPEPRPDLLTRPRLMRSLVGRWLHRVTSIVGGPGLGKTTLLTQAIAENRLAPRGDDVWVGLDPHDADADRLARVVAAALGNTERSRDEIAPDPAAVADAVWRRSPTYACLVFDDVHLLPAGSAGAAWLAGLVEALPANGHVVLASRSEPPMSLTRFGTQGAVLRLTEDDLRFSDDELSRFAAQRGLDPAWLGGTAGWPAMAELAASVHRGSSGAYLWEEVLEPLGTVRRQLLAVLCDLGGADDELISAAAGTAIDLASALDGVPLVARGADGWHVPHGLWRSAPGIALAPAEHLEVPLRAIEHLSARGRFDDALSLVDQAELWEAAPTIIRSACLANDLLVPGQIRRWLLASPESVRVSSAGRLAAALDTAPARALEPLRKAEAQARVDGDLDAELAALAQLCQHAWWQQDLGALGELVARLFEVEPTGHPRARALVTIARAMLADLAGDDSSVIAELERGEQPVPDDVSRAYPAWLSGVVHLDRGDVDAAYEIVERLTEAAGGATPSIVDDLRLRISWRRGRVADVLAEIPAVAAAEARGGAAYTTFASQILASVLFSHTGDIKAAQHYLDNAAISAPSTVGGPDVLIASATASLQLADGHEARAAATLRDALKEHGLDAGTDRRAWRQVLPLVYVLVPETRRHWDGAPLRGFLQIARQLAATVVAIRSGSGPQLLRTLDLPDLAIVRSALHHRFAAELAVGLNEAQRPEGGALLDLLHPAGRRAVRELVVGKATQARPAKALLAATPAPPLRVTYLAMLGPTVLCRDVPDGAEIVDPHLREKRVQSLVAFLVCHRRTTRGAIAAALWPDLDDRSAANNLGVALNKGARPPRALAGEPRARLHPSARQPDGSARDR